MQMTVDEERGCALPAPSIERPSFATALLEGVAQAAVILTRSPHIESALAQALGILGQAAEVDRVNVFRHAHEESAMYLFAEWAREGVRLWSSFEAGPLYDQDFPEVIQPTQRGEVYYSHLREKSGVNAHINACMGTRTDLLVPVFVEGRYWGLLNFDDCTRERHWKDGEIEVLRIAAEIIAAVLQRWETEKRHLRGVEQFNLALQRNAAKLTMGVDLRDYLGHVLKECLVLMGADFGHVLTYDAETDALSFAVGARPGRIYREPLAEEPEIFRRPFPSSSFPVFEFVRSQRRAAVLSRHAREAPLSDVVARWFAAERVCEAACLLLVVGEEPLGFVGLAFRSERALSPEQIELFQAMANQAALAIAMSRLSERARVVAVLDERARIAGQIHDTLAQQFTGTLLHLEALSIRAARGYRVTPDDLQTVRKIAAFGLAEARRSALNLRPMELDGGNLSDALQQLADRSRVSGLLDCEYSRSGHLGRMDAALEDALLRIAHEAVNNAIRHADASRLMIRLAQGDTGIQLEISDDGCGFDCSVARQRGLTFGLRSMEARAAGMGALFTVKSEPGHGTVVTVQHPAP